MRRIPIKLISLLSLLPLFPIGYLLGLILKFAVDVPFWDEWDLVPLLEKVYKGTWSVWDFWHPHNEHRLVLPKILLILIARVSHWNVIYILLINFVLAVGTFFLLLRYMNQTTRTFSDSQAWWLPFIISLFVFSLSQFENWFMGFQLCVFLNVLSIVVGAGLLTQAFESWKHFFGAVGFGVMATFSFANGLLYWPIALLILLLLTVAECARRRTSGVKLLLWLLIGLTMSWLYMHDSGHSRSPLAVRVVWEQPLSYVGYIFSYLGSPLAIFTVRSAFGVQFSVIVGAAGTVAFGLLLWHLVTRYRVALSSLAFSFALGSYAIGSALITGIGRTGLGLTQSLSSRYIIFSSLLWIANAALLAFLSHARAESARLTEVRFRTIEYIAMVVVVLLLSFSSVAGTVAAVKRAEKRRVARDELLRPHDAQLLQPLYPDITIVKERAETLKRYRLSLFRETLPQ